MFINSINRINLFKKCSENINMNIQKSLYSCLFLNYNNKNNKLFIQHPAKVEYQTILSTMCVVHI